MTKDVADAREHVRVANVKLTVVQRSRMRRIMVLDLLRMFVVLCIQ